jgi:hypothetical protein
MFRYLLVDHAVPAICHSLAAARLRADLTGRRVADALASPLREEDLTDKHRGSQRICQRSRVVQCESELRRIILSFEKEGGGQCGETGATIERSSFSSWNVKFLKNCLGAKREGTGRDPG